MGFVLKSLEVEGEHADHLTYTTAPSELQLLWNLFMSYCSSLKQKKRSICPPSNVGFQSNFLSHSEWKLVGWRKWKINQSTVLFAHNEAASVISQSCIDNTRYICEGGGVPLANLPTYSLVIFSLVSRSDKTCLLLFNNSRAVWPDWANFWLPFWRVYLLSKVAQWSA